MTLCRLLGGVLWVAGLGLGTVVAGCAAPAPVVALRPHGAEVVWVAGRASVQREQDGVRVATAFEHQDGERLAVRVEVENRTDGRIELGPQDITFITCSDLTPASCSRNYLVINPEEELAQVERKQSIEQASAANAAVFHGSLLLLSAVTDVTAVAAGKTDRTTGLRTAAIANELENDSLRQDSALASYAAQRELWSNAALRRNTIFPGAGCGGLVYFPLDLKARYVWIDVWTPGGHRFPFLFEQVVTPVVPEKATHERFASSVATSTNTNR